jgi:hypothetical protein
MDVLLDDVIAAQPGEVEPVSHLPFEVSPFSLTVFLPQPALIPVAAGRDYLAYETIVNAAHGFEVAFLMAALSAGGYGERFHFRFFVSGKHHSDARSVYGYGFFGEDILARSDGGFNVLRAKSGRSGEYDVIGVGRKHFLEGIEACEASLVGYFHRGGMFFAELFSALVEAVFEDIAHRHEFDPARGGDGIDYGSRAASSASYQTDSDRVAPCGISADAGGKRGSYNRAA